MRIIGWLGLAALAFTVGGTAQATTREWLRAWNQHDLDAVMRLYADRLEFVSPLVVERLGRADGTITRKDELRDYFARSGVAAIVFPATMLPAPKIGEEDMEVEVRGRRMPLDVAMARNIAPGSTAGLPGLVLPAGLTTSGLPVALEFDGPPGADHKMLELGLALEAALGKLPPPTGALTVTAT